MASERSTGRRRRSRISRQYSSVYWMQRGIFIFFAATCCVFVVQAQETNTTNATDAPTDEPNATIVPTTVSTPPPQVPTGNPTSSPSITAMPSMSKEPSAFPTQSSAPSASSAPSGEQEPTVSPKPPTTPPPTGSVAEEFNIQMNLVGFQRLETDSSIAVWENITSQHVRRYWNERDYDDFNVSDVLTKLISQISVVPTPAPAGQEERQADAAQAKNMTPQGLVYDQRIRFINDSQGPLDDQHGEDVLFLRPFRMDSQVYVDQLRVAFNIANPIIFKDIFIIPLPEPTMAPTNDKKMTTGAIAGTAVGATIGCALIGVVVIWYITRRRDDVIDEDSVGHLGDGPPVIPTEEDPRWDAIEEDDDISDMEPYSEAGVSYRAAGDSSTLPETEEPLDYISDDDPLHISDRGDGSLHVGVPLDDAHEDSEYGENDSQEELYEDSSAHQPSMSGFKLQITQIEE